MNRGSLWHLPCRRILMTFESAGWRPKPITNGTEVQILREYDNNGRKE